MSLNLRIGLGWDVHPFKEGRDLYLGGIKIPSDRGLDGHSDADALSHAVVDAILGALGEEAMM
jgi:2-C-methyl-D-erythritol 2,4-cyclodiphosphate synthase